MRERICQLAAGDIHADVPVMDMPRVTVEADIAYGQNYRGDIHISSGNQLAFRGLVYSDDSRILLPHSTFSGNNVFIPYDVMAEELEEGTVLEGHFSLIYNGGECRLPYRFRVLHGGREHEVPLVTLEDFAAYARTNPEGASALFESRDFLRLPFMDDLAVRGLYDGLRRAVNHKNLVEEFLCGTGAKERVVLSLDPEKLEILVEEKSVVETIRLTRSTWGFLPIGVRCEHPAVRVSRKELSDKDFDGDSFSLQITVDQSGLHAGRNLTELVIETPMQEFHVELVMIRKIMDERRSRKLHQRRESEVEFHKTLVNVLIHQAENNDELDYLQACWDEMVQCNEPTLRQMLYHAAICLWKGDAELAKSILTEAKPLAEGGRREDVDAYCAYLYLQLQVVKNWERREQILKILHLYENAEGASEFLFLLMLHMEDGLNDRPMEMLDRIRGYYDAGSRSPYLYMEACRIYNRHPDILKKLDEFERNTLIFGARKQMLTEEVAVYVAKLSSQVKSKLMFICRILKTLYRTYAKDEILTGICQILIRCECRRDEDFEWYALGVKQDIRLTRLYDYYLQSVTDDYDQALPREIMLYFSYNSPRDTESQKTLYRNLYAFASDDEKLMRSYKDQIELFVRQQVLSGKAGSELAEIDSDILYQLHVDDQVARMLPDVLHAVEVTCKETHYSEVIAVYGETEEEFSAPVVNGKACIPVYSENCRILFADRFGNRFSGVGCEQRRLFTDNELLLMRCLEIYPRHTMMRLEQCIRILAARERNLDQIRYLRKELETRTLQRFFKKQMMSAIADYVISRRDPDEEEVITCVRYSGITPRQRSGLVQILIEQGQLTEASRQARRIGFRELPPASLRRLVSLTIQNGLFTLDETLLDMSRYLFELDQCDDMILEYLCTHYNTASRDMIPVLKLAVERGVPTHGMEERLLAQMLFTGERQGLDDVFLIYAGQESGERLLVHAYFSVKCDSYFCSGEPINEEVFDYVRQLLDQDSDNVPKVCELALLRHYAAKSALTPEETSLCSRLLGETIRSGMQFAWMKQLRGKTEIPENITQREWLEFHGTPDLSLRMRVLLLPQDEKKEPTCVVMPQVYPGIYVYSFLLFEGESIMYEIYRENDQAILARGTCSGQASPADDHSRFAELNRLQMMTRDVEHVNNWQQDVLNYGMQDAWTEQIFTID